MTKAKLVKSLRLCRAKVKWLFKVLIWLKDTPKPSQTTPGGIITKEAPINVSNVAIVDPKSGKASKIGYKEENGNKVRLLANPVK